VSVVVATLPSVAGVPLVEVQYASVLRFHLWKWRPVKPMQLMK